MKFMDLPQLKMYLKPETIEELRKALHENIRDVRDLKPTAFQDPLNFTHCDEHLKKLVSALNLLAE